MKLSDDVIEDESTSTFNSRLLDLGLSSLERLNRRFKLQKRRQLFIRTHNETLSASQDRARIVFDSRMDNIVQGSKCGVYGESVSLPTNRETPEFRAMTGVCGIGNDYGVFGKGFTTAGVYGENEASGAGVTGEALGGGANLRGARN